MKPNVLAVVLGGGQGSRLHPLTATRSKPAVPIAGKYRLVDIPISNCLNSDIDRIFVLTQFNSASLNKHIKNTYHFGVFSSGFVDILAAEQTPNNTGWFQGTADAVRQSLKHFSPFEFDYVLILSGDQLYQMDFNEMIANHIERNAEISVATIPVTAKDASSFGIMKSDHDSNITAFIEKPKTGIEEWASEVSAEMKTQQRLYMASMGIYVFNRSTIYDVLNSNDHTDFGKEIIPAAIAERTVVSYEYDGYWTDIGTIPSFFEANLALTDDIPKFNLFDTKSIFTRARMLPPSKILNTSVERTVIADGCIIEAERIQKAVVGVRSRIGLGSIVENAYIMGADYYQTLEEMEKAKNSHAPIIGVGERCFIKNAILDKNCSIGNDVRIVGSDSMEDGDYDTYTVREGIVVVKKSAAIPDGTIIE